jgi:IclR family transcriptional regulator, mhp operon transcriptional activator
VAKYKSVRSLRRGLQLLCALNRHNGASVQLLAEASGINRTSVYRVLGTLEELGFVRQGPSDENFRLTAAVRQLSDGLNEDAWVANVAGPVLKERHPGMLWPMNVATFDYDAMLIRESSHRYSPFAIHHSVVGSRLPMLETVLGQVYLAFCPDREREGILEILRASKGPEAELANDATYVRDFVRRARRNGYVARPGLREKRIGAIGVPIMRDARLFAALNMLFFRSAMSVPAAVERHLEYLRGTAHEIASRLRPEDSPSSVIVGEPADPKKIPEPQRLGRRRGKNRLT